MDELSRITRAIIDMSGDVSALVRREFRTIARSEETAGRQDMATRLDHEVGKYIGDRLLREFGDIVYIDSEEPEERKGSGKYVVRLDPLDGTKHVISGIALVSTLVSVSVDAMTEFALMIHPFTDKIYTATRGKGASMNGHPIRVNDQSIYDNFVIHEQPTSSLFRDNPSLFAKKEAYLHLLMSRAYRLRNVGNGSISVGWVAEGAATSYVDLSGTTKLYDIEAALLIAQEAGAVVGDCHGRIIDRASYQRGDDRKVINEDLLIANPRAFKEIVDLFMEANH